MTELAKTFLAHPYAVLGTSTRETLKELEERRREAVLFGDEKNAERAFEALIHPASRLAEELRWFLPDEIPESLANSHREIIMDYIGRI